MGNEFTEVPELIPRNETAQPLKDLVRQKESSIGQTPEQRLEWLMQQTPVELSQFLIDVNKTARGITGQNRFDGEGVHAGLLLGSEPPDQQDKEPILHTTFKNMQSKAQQLLESGVAPQEILDQFAVAIPTIANKLHFFAQGNGRTSRFLRMIIRDGSTDLDKRLQGIIAGKHFDTDDFDTYDTTPIRGIDRVLTRVLSERHETQSIKINDDVSTDDDDLLEVDMDVYKKARSSFEGLDRRIADSQIDSINFKETVRVNVKRKGIWTSSQDGTTNVSLRSLLSDLSTDAEKQREFLDDYRQIRKERAMLWGNLLTGDVNIVMPEKDIRLGSINFARESKKLTRLSSSDIHTALQLQTAYEESRSPLRNIPQGN